MSEPLPLGLAQQEKARPVDPDHLEKLGKSAAQKYQEGGTSLTEAVVETVKEAMLSPEQVKRVCEFANTTAYLAAFEKAGNVRNVTFEGGPANPARVLQDLNDGSSPTLLTEGSDYKAAAANFRSRMEMDALAHAFQVPVADSLAKTASVHIGSNKNHQEHANPVDDLWDMKLALEGVRDELISMKTGAALVHADVSGQMLKAAEQEMMDGTSLWEIAKAFSAVSENPQPVKEAMLLIRDHLVEHGHSREKVASSLIKVAGDFKAPNIEHPLLVRFSAFVKAAHALRVVDAAMLNVETQIKQTDKAISGVLV